MRRHSRGAWPYSFPPNCAFGLNRASPQAEALRLWLPPLGSRGANVLQDYGGRGLDGAITNGTWVTDALLGWVLSLSGTGGSSIQVSHHEDIDFADENFTISMYVKADENDFAIGDRLFCKGRGGGGVLGIRYEATINPSFDTMDFVIDDGSTKSAVVYANLTNWADNKPHMLVFARDTADDKIRIFNDGVQVAEAADNTGSIANSYDFYLGRQDPIDATADIKCQFGDVRISRGLLPPSVIYQMAHDAKWDLYRPVRQPAAASVGFRRHMGMTGVGVEIG